METDIYKSPESDLVAENTTNKQQLATRGSRLLAAIIDGLILAPLTLPLMFILGVFDNLASGVGPSLLQSFAWGMLGNAIFLLVNGYFLATWGQTLGKRIVGIKIVEHDKTPVKINSLIKRYSVYLLLPQVPVMGQILSLINILFIFSKARLCIHDLVGGTKVVKIDEQPVPSAA